MSPELENLNPAFAELSEETRAEVYARMQRGEVFFLLMNVKEIVDYFEEERQLQAAEAARIEAIKIIQEERDKMAAVGVEKSGIFEALKPPSFKERAADIFERYFLNPIGRPIFNRGALIGATSCVASVAFLAMGMLWFGLHELIVIVFLIGIIFLISFFSYKDLGVASCGLGCLCFSLLFFSVLWFWKMPVSAQGSNYVVFSQDAEIVDILGPQYWKIMDSRIARKTNREMVSKTNYIYDNSFYTDECTGRAVIAFCLTLSQDGIKQWFKEGGNLTSALADLQFKIQKVVNQPIESSDKVDIKKMAVEILKVENMALSLSSVEIKVDWHRNSGCKRVNCDLFESSETVKLMKH